MFYSGFRILQNYLLSSFFYDLLNELMPVEFLEAKLGLTKVSESVIRIYRFIFNL